MYPNNCNIVEHNVNIQIRELGGTTPFIQSFLTYIHVKKSKWSKYLEKHFDGNVIPVVTADGDAVSDDNATVDGEADIVDVTDVDYCKYIRVPVFVKLFHALDPIDDPSLDDFCTHDAAHIIHQNKSIQCIDTYRLLVDRMAREDIVSVNKCLHYKNMAAINAKREYYQYIHDHVRELLKWLHSNNINHNDLHFGNIMMYPYTKSSTIQYTPDGPTLPVINNQIPVLIDFGRHIPLNGSNDDYDENISANGIHPEMTIPPSFAKDYSMFLLNLIGYDSYITIPQCIHDIVNKRLGEIKVYEIEGDLRVVNLLSILNRVEYSKTKVKTDDEKYNSMLVAIVNEYLRF